jgi:2-polyprenyl-3-methyl-5-hydroxy-6-metoxy-1,4-benzoquinol methylase
MMKKSRTFETEVLEGERFEFGKNWQDFLENLNEEQINECKKSLKEFLQIKDLKEKSFIDVGSGSGIMSLAAVQLGAKVYSFDYDPSSVWCTEQLRKRFNFDKKRWHIEQGSILDEKYINRLGVFDIVYSWGVLHHTGNMMRAFDLISKLVKPKGGKLFIAIYNDQGIISVLWRFVKQFYCKSPQIIKTLLVWLIGICIWGVKFVIDLIKLKPFDSWKNYHKMKRGMSPWHNVVDWVGGYPFEVAKPQTIIDFFNDRGYETLKTKTVGLGQANNQFVFRKTK